MDPAVQGIPPQALAILAQLASGQTPPPAPAAAPTPPPAGTLPSLLGQWQQSFGNPKPNYAPGLSILPTPPGGMAGGTGTGTGGTTTPPPATGGTPPPKPPFGSTAAGQRALSQQLQDLFSGGKGAPNAGGSASGGFGGAQGGASQAIHDFTADNIAQNPSLKDSLKLMASVPGILNMASEVVKNGLGLSNVFNDPSVKTMNPAALQAVTDAFNNALNPTQTNIAQALAAATSELAVARALSAQGLGANISGGNAGPVGAVGKAVGTGAMGTGRNPASPNAPGAKGDGGGGGGGNTNSGGHGDPGSGAGAGTGSGAGKADAG